MMEKWIERIDLDFPHLCLVREMEKWKDELFFFSCGEKGENRKYSLYKFTIISVWDRKEANDPGKSGLDFD